jgi:hypothetical protein
LAGRIENWRLGPNGDDLRTAPFFTDHDDSPNFNKLFAALYDLIFGRMTNMGLMIPRSDRTLEQIFLEKVNGTDHDLVSPELVAYLKWLIYIAPYEQRNLVEHEKFYSQELAFLKDPKNAAWRVAFFDALEEWYSEHAPTKKRRSISRGVESVRVDVNRRFKNIDKYDGRQIGARAAAADADADAAATAAALAAAAAAAVASGGSGGQA